MSVGFSNITLNCQEHISNRINSFHSNQLSSLSRNALNEVAKVKVYIQYALAGLVGAIPFAVAKIGEGVVKGSAFLAIQARNFSVHLGVFGFISEIFFRAVVGIPTAIGGALLGGGAVAFSKSQALVWGQYLIEHPQEEKVNTQLARYGTSDKPWKDFKSLLETYFLPFSSLPVAYDPDADEGELPDDYFNIDDNLRRIQNFIAN